MSCEKYELTVGVIYGPIYLAKVIPVLLFWPSVLPKVNLYLGLTTIDALLRQRHRTRTALALSRPDVTITVLPGGFRRRVRYNRGAERMLCRRMWGDHVRPRELSSSPRKGAEDSCRGHGQVGRAH